MPEIPEIACRAVEMNTALPGKTIKSIEILQPKSLNLPISDFQSALTGAQIKHISYHGKWLQIETSQGWLLLNMGMGGEILLVDRDHLPAKYRLVFDFTDATCLTINFWWFGYVHFAAMDELSKHEMTAKLGPNILDLTEEEFSERLRTLKGKLKANLIDQTRFAGIGNAYIHDILFLAQLHPNRLISSLSDEEIHRLFEGIQNGLLPSLKKGGAFYEMNLFGEKGNFQLDDIIIGYRAGQPCPTCRTPIMKIKTGSTSSFICPTCQPEK
ncbi:MAG: Fpg/Nei family DNA glycosylase [Anaerolineaceae bacterium]